MLIKLFFQRYLFFKIFYLTSSIRFIGNGKMGQFQIFEHLHLERSTLTQNMFLEQRVYNNPLLKLLLHRTTELTVNDSMSLVK
jgi:hypothetical protein